MAYISFAAGSRSDKSIQTFITLCDELGIKILFYGRKKFSFMGTGNAHLIELFVTSRDLFHLLQEELSHKFSISQMYPATITSLEDIEKSLFRIEDALERSFLVECHQCKRPLSEPGNFCPYCGNEVNINLKICPACSQVYAPSYNFCLDCGEELQKTKAEVSDYENAEDFLLGIPKEDVEL